MYDWHNVATRTVRVYDEAASSCRDNSLMARLARANTALAYPPPPPLSLHSFECVLKGSHHQLSLSRLLESQVTCQTKFDSAACHPDLLQLLGHQQML